MNRIWVTGIAGFLGAQTARVFLERGWDVVGLGNPPAMPGDDAVSVRDGAPARISGPIDAESLALALDCYGAPDVVVHAAGSGTVAPSFTDPLKDFERAVATTAVLLDCLRKAAPGAHVLLPSSAAVYGIRSAEPISEIVEPAPVSPYGFHKWMAEILCRQTSHTFGQRISVVRFFSLYGPRLRKQILWDLSNRLRLHPAELVMDGTGEESRDMLYVDDAVDLLYLAAAQETDGLSIINGGTGRATTVRQLAQGLIDRISPSTCLNFTGKVRAGDPRHLLADVRRLAKLGYTPNIAIEQGLDRYVRWFEQAGVNP